MQKTKYNGIYKKQEGILLNLDNEALQQYKLNKQKSKRMNSIDEDVQVLKKDMQEIKELLMKVLEK